MKVLLISCALLVFTRTATDGAGNGTIQLFVNSIQQCLGHPVTLTCHHLVPRPRGDRYIPDDYFEVNHQNKGTTIISSREENVHFTANATTTTMTLTLCEEYNGNWSCFMTNRGHEFRSNNVTINALDQPKSPANIVSHSDISSITLAWEQDKECYENTTFKFIVSVTKPGDNEGSMMLETLGTFLNISSLEHSTKYLISVWAVNSENEQVKSKEVHFSQRTSDVLLEVIPNSDTSPSVSVGETIGLSCTVNSSLTTHALNIEWIKGASSISPDNRIEVQSEFNSTLVTSTLMIRDAVKSDEDTYYCVSTNGAKNESVQFNVYVNITNGQSSLGVTITMVVAAVVISISSNMGVPSLVI